MVWCNEPSCNYMETMQGLLHTKALINHTSFWPGAGELFPCDSISFAIASLVYAPFVEENLPLALLVAAH